MTISALVSPARYEHIVSPNDTLSQSLDKVKSSHESIFVLGKNDQFLGFISPYQVLYKHRAPYKAKVSSYLLHPPYITKNTSLNDTAGFMASLRTYTLPVFDNNQRVIGYLNGDDLLRQAVANPTLMQQLNSTLRWREPITAPVKNTVNNIYRLLRQKKLARVVLVNDTGHLAGIITRSDLQTALMGPSDRQRFNSPTNTYFDEDVADRSTKSIEPFVMTQVLTASTKDTPIAALKKMLKSGIHSIVRIDGEGKPNGFLSRFDFLTALIDLKPKSIIPLLLTISTPDLQEYYSLVSTWYAEDFFDKHQRQLPIRQLKLHLKSSQNATGKPSLFSGNFTLTLKNGQHFFAKTQHHWFKQVLIDGFNKLDKQLRRLH